MFSDEFAKSSILRWALAALIFNYYIVFSRWIGNSTITLMSSETHRFVCPVYFQDCSPFYFLEALPYGYSQTYFYMLMFALLLWAIYLMSKQRWAETQLTLIPFFIWHILNVFFFTAQQGGNYEYYLVVFGLVLLFLPHKVFFLKLSVVMFYVLSTVAKSHPAWIEGDYFNHLRTGLPLFPDWSIPFFSNFVILMEMVGAWFLMSKNLFLQRAALIFFAIFHLYSGILVEYRYPSTVLPMILILFGPWYQYTPVPLTRKSIAGWSMILLLVFLQFSPKLIPGDEKLTLEGNAFGLYMFEANHQCVSQPTYYYKDGRVKHDVSTSNSARSRCETYKYWFQLQNKCKADSSIERIAWTFDHSINGDPFLRIVDVEDACSLDFKAFSHNEWIKTHEDNPEVIGWPVKNIYH